MNEIVNSQTLLFLKSIQIGIGIAMIYDLVRIFRKIMPHPNWLVQVEDALYWIICTCLGFGVLYVHNYGDIRLFIFLGMILGAIFYLLTFSIIFMRIATYMIDVLKRVVIYIIRVVSIPLKWLCELILIPIRALYAYSKYLKECGRQKNKKMKQQYYYYKADKKTQKRIRKKINPSDHS